MQAHSHPRLTAAAAPAKVPRFSLRGGFADILACASRLSTPAPVPLKALPEYPTLAEVVAYNKARLRQLAQAADQAQRRTRLAMSLLLALAFSTKACAPGDARFQPPARPVASSTLNNSF